MPIRCPSCQRDNREGSRFCAKCGSSLSTVEPRDPLIGRLLSDRYRVVRLLGEGGMGRVYLAQQQLGTATRFVALKVLHGAHSTDATVRQRFYRECEVVVGLTHPNTVQFYDFGELDDGRLFIVMENIEGMSLGEALAEGPMPLARVERLLNQIAGSLAEAHERGIVHRDLKPENVMLTTRGGEHDFVKVCDFGIAKRQDESARSQLTLQGTVIGTPQYMSPEQLMGGLVDGRSDVYSLGLIVYEMLAGERPFSASTPLEWAARHTTAEPPPLSSYAATEGLPPHVQQAVLRALEKLPADRPQSARAFAREVLGTTTERTAPFSAGPSETPGVPATGTAPTVLASPVAARRREAPEPDDDRVLKPRGVAPLWPRVLAVLGILGGLGAGAFGYLFHGSAASSVVSNDAGVESDAGRDGGDASALLETPTEWLRIVHYQLRVTDASDALGPPDGQYAIVRPNGTITLELAAGTRVATDGASGPDLVIELDDARSGPYRVDVAAARNQFTTVGSEVVGSLPLDSDQFEIAEIRYVRIKNRGRGNIYLDAVGAFRATEVAAR